MLLPIRRLIKWVLVIVSIDGSGVHGFMMQDVNDGLSVVIGPLAITRASIVSRKFFLSLTLLVEHVKYCKAVEAI